MKIIHRYIAAEFLRNLAACLFITAALFTMIDFFDRIDIFIAEKAPLGSIFKYFAFKLPNTLMLTLPIAVLVTTMFTVGILSKNSEVIAMRAAGLTVMQAFKPLFLCGIIISVTAIALKETLVPYAFRRVSEIYNIDIRQKDKKGKYNQADFWWRDKNNFYSLESFDSRDSSIHRFTWLEINPDFKVIKRTDAAKAIWVSDDFGWNMKNVQSFNFENEIKLKNYPSIPLLINQDPSYFYNTQIDPDTMGFFQFRKYLKDLKRNGIQINSQLSDLYAKLSFPFINFVAILVCLPFALRPSRTSNIAMSFMAGLTIGFSYYVIHAFSLSLARLDIWEPLLGAWMANILMLFVGVILNWGAEAP